VGSALRQAIGTTKGRALLLLGVVAALWVGSSVVAKLTLDEYGSLWAALWSGLLHLLDPSSLHDDQGWGQRAIGLVQVVTGLVLVVGLIFTVLGEVVSSSLERLGRIERPYPGSGHLAFVGGLDTLPYLLRALDQAPSQWGVRPAPHTVVVLAPFEQRDERDDILSSLRGAAGGFDLRLVFGDVAGPGGFDLAGLARADVVVVGSVRSGRGRVESSDVEVLRSGTALDAYLREREARPRRPRVLLIFRRGVDADAAWGLFPSAWDAIVGDRGAAAVLHIAISHPRFAAVLPSATQPMRRPQVVHAPELAGVRFAQLHARFATAIPLGLVRRDAEQQVETLVPPPPAEVVGPRDGVLVLSPDGRAQLRAAPADVPVPVSLSPADERPPARPRRVLVVGWNFNGRGLLEELRNEPEPTVLTVLGSADQWSAFAAPEPPPTVELRRRTGSPTDPAAIAEALSDADPDVVLVLASSAAGDLANADATAVLTLLHVRRLTEGRSLPLVLRVFGSATAATLEDERLTRLSSADVISAGLALAVLAPDSAVGIEALIGSERTTLEVVRFRPADGRPASFGAVYQAVLQRGAVPIGVDRGDGRADIAPATDAPVGPGDELLVARRVPASRTAAPAARTGA
jgi:hypothetical protein